MIGENGVSQRNIIIASSGTGGHIYPGIALAKEFQKKSYKPIFFITDNAAAREILKISGFEYIAFNAIGMPRKISFSFIPFTVKMIFTFLKALKQILTINPIAVVGTGAYIAVPVIFAAKIFRKKIFIHEQNRVPGKANILLNKITDKTFVSFKHSEKYFKNKNIFFSGYPIRKNILSASKENALKILNLENNVFTILVFGGSLGAVKLNEIVCKTLLGLIQKNKFQVLHITGSNNYVYIKDQVRGFANYRVFEYMNDIAPAYAASNIVICRSGAGTVFELKALNKFAILVPYPYATDNHQYWNAKEIEKSGKIIVIEEKDLTKERLVEKIHVLKNNMEDSAVENIADIAQKLMFEEIIKCIKS
ncbi:UDP-N-acetylglucosamine--N-acetylmuramyl-(pentapeptide) pyrophosphoryl-undecaprenol N-acetylglucosamine transferase [Endomicrobiia bacterium]|nr:UDP-N-acetylglucosamine--N-acetylmuramyl-(pentapeptide) pyrophosphoryl-undecaprenol N-acetylglucosamine transferase [Endomicrobiia bacterium]